MIRSLAIVVPVLDDWASFARVVAGIAEHLTDSDVAAHVYAVDDGSLAAFDPASIALPPASCIVSIEIIRLALNLGHQRAIAVGLSALSGNPDLDAILVMDGDGEDRPSDIPALLAAGRARPDSIILAGRAKRSEPAAFRVWYRLYQFIFHVLTGQTIRFGNFSLLPMRAVRRLVYMPELWNHLAASIMRSRLPHIEVPTERGYRFAGQSHMNLVALIVHGLSALSVQTDMIFVRVLLASVAIAIVDGIGIAIVTAIRFGTTLAIPGWATTAVGDLLIILLLTLVVVIAATLTMLAGRSQRPIVPVVDTPQFITERLPVFPAAAAAEREPRRLSG